MIRCTIPGCDAVLQQVEGLHSPGDAPMVFGPHGPEYVRCPKCTNLIVWPPLEQPPEDASNVTPLHPAAD
jgi:hypothetical protein